MSWAVLTDPEIIRQLRTATMVAVRYVCLAPPTGGPQITLDDLKKTAQGLMSAPFMRKYELRVYNTDPATVVVHDIANDTSVAVYVWCGSGGTIHSARDDRMVQLANALDVEFNGWEEPVDESWLPPAKNGSSSAAGPTVATGAERVSSPGIGVSSDELANVYQRYGTSQQFIKLTELLGLGCKRKAALWPEEGAAPGNVVFEILGPNGETLYITPKGTVEAVF